MSFVQTVRQCRGTMNRGFNSINNFYSNFNFKNTQSCQILQASASGELPQEKVNVNAKPTCCKVVIFNTPRSYHSSSTTCPHSPQKVFMSTRTKISVLLANLKLKATTHLLTRVTASAYKRKGSKSETLIIVCVRLR